MKNRWILACSAWISVFLLTIAAAAAETYPSMADLYQHWSATQMPDWVCSVVSADGSSERLALSVSVAGILLWIRRRKSAAAE